MGLFLGPAAVADGVGALAAASVQIADALAGVAGDRGDLVFRRARPHCDSLRANPGSTAAVAGSHQSIAAIVARGHARVIPHVAKD